MPPDLSISQICTQIMQAPLSPQRRLIAVVGPPGSGKSTVSDMLANTLQAMGHMALVVPMDGFHLDNRLLDLDGTRAEKGAPHTFDARGVLRLVSAMQDPADVVYPQFDRSSDIAIAGAGRLPTACETVLIEGNYLLYDAPVWRELAQHWSLSIALTPPRALLRQRLVQRWLDHDMPPDQAIARAEGNDLKNADRVLENMLPADIILNEVPT